VSTITLQVNVPVDLRDLGFTQDEIDREVLTALVLKGFREGVVSSAKAARLLSMNRIEFLDLLERERIPIFNPTDQELEAEFEMARRLARQGT
jgi:predicted HTH domain antitoxin